MTLREQLGLASADTLFDRIATGRGLTPPPDPPDLRGYVGLALRSGFPEPTLRLSAAARERWLESYVEQLLTRDVAAIAPRRDPSRLRRYFEAYALNSAGVVDERTLFDAAGVNRRTALAYEDLLERLHVAEPLPAWSSNRLSRLVRSPKRYVTDPALIAAALGTDTEGVLRDGDLLGRVLDTFVASQLRPELTVSAARPRLHHVRDHGGRHEIDLVAEVGAHDVVATEIKATAAPGRGDAKHLAWLRDRIGARFKVGIVFHTGPRAYSLGERLTAVPIAALWAEG
jgi:predicted AAA+ superfamily ATPase